MADDLEPMSEPHEPCERCGELGCRPALHPERGSELAWTATTGALLGATLVGLLAVPAWLRRLPRRVAPEGHPRERQRQDRLVTGATSAALMAVLSLAVVVVAVVEHRHGDRLSAWAGGPETDSEEPPDELGQVLRRVVQDDPGDAELGMDQLLEIAPSLTTDGIERLALAYDELREAPRATDQALRLRTLREALRRNERPAASEALADLYDAIDDPVERDLTLAALGRCAAPEALERVIESETRRYRTPRLAAQLNIGCVQHVTHALLGLAHEHRPERPATYMALASACDFQPGPMRASAGAAIAEAWLQVGELPAAERGSPDVHRLAHALACADEALLDEALAAVPAEADEWTRAELRLASFRRGRMSLDDLLEEAEGSPALRRQLDAHYREGAPWQDAVVGRTTRDRSER